MARKVLLILALIVAIGAGVFIVWQNRQPTPAELLKAEQEVYTALLEYEKSTYSAEYILGSVVDKHQIIEYTNSGELKGNTPTDSAGYTAGFNTDEFPDLQRKTWIDYQEKNKVSYPIKDFLPPTADVMLVNPANGKQLYWWISFSRIGFNPSLTQALVLVGDCRGELCYDSMGNFMYSQGFYVFLQKENGVWKIKDQTDVWLIEAPSP